MPGAKAEVESGRITSTHRAPSITRAPPDGVQFRLDLRKPMWQIAAELIVGTLYM